MADLTLKQAFAKNKEKADNRYAKPDGFYERMGVGRALLAENLVAQLGILDTDAYQFRTAGGNADIAGTKKVHKIVGRTVKWNQLVQNGNFESTSGWGTTGGTISASNNVLSFVIKGTPTSIASQRVNQQVGLITGNRYLVLVKLKTPYDTDIRVFMTDRFNVLGRTTANMWSNLYGIFTAVASTSTGNLYFDCFSQASYQAGDTIQVSNYMIINLTALGLDSITALEQFYATDLGKLVKAVGYLDYTEGSIATTDIIKMRNVGYNAWDEEYRIGSIQYDKNQSNFGQDISGLNVCSKNYIKVIPGQAYSLEPTSSQQSGIVFCYDASKNPIIVGTSGYIAATGNSITLPNSCYYVRFYMAQPYGSVYKNDVAFHLAWSGSRTGYEEHKVYEYPAVFKGYSVGGVGDEYYPDGHIVRKFGIVDLGTLAWTGANEYGETNSDSLGGIIKTIANANVILNCLCDKYRPCSANQLYHSTTLDKVIAQWQSSAATGRRLTVLDTDLIGKNSAEVKQAMSGVYLIYELATPTTEQGQPYDEEQIVDDYGTEEFVFKTGEMPVPVGHETFYQVNLQNFVQRMYQGLEGDAGNVAKADDLEALDNRVEALEGSRLYKHTVRAVSGSETFNLMIVSPISTQLNTVLLLEEAYEAGKIVQCTGTFVNGGTTENVMNALMQNNLFGVSLINATNQTVACRVVAGTVTDTVELL